MSVIAYLVSLARALALFTGDIPLGIALLYSTCFHTARLPAREPKG